MNDRITTLEKYTASGSSQSVGASASHSAALHVPVPDVMSWHTLGSAVPTVLNGVPLISLAAAIHEHLWNQIIAGNIVLCSYMHALRHIISHYMMA